ncbi:hypothetical protein Cgig2_009430 [Carnegiea gigantea]|uniref:4-hydroxy-4-methyl-2-oxoglutarate aldolase n=1 Tax=Carnegiea gigantea TaxID=171969 RepID=A0A9Q1JSL2_9CARY|nr:hypothetical protein Cgig2_009430 [Carnegiea gigantea]
MVATTDICDAHPSLLKTGELRVLLPLFQSYGKRRAFHGPIVTVKVFEDNVLVRQLLEAAAAAYRGKVLVVDGGGSRRCALLGGNLARLAQDNGWAGVVVNGCVRDVDEINGCDIGVKALGPSPVKSEKKGAGLVYLAPEPALSVLVNTCKLLDQQHRRKRNNNNAELSFKIST